MKLAGWTARASIHWIAGVIGITIYAISVFILLQCIFGEHNPRLKIYTQIQLILPPSLRSYVLPSIRCKLVCRKRFLPFIVRIRGRAVLEANVS